jgi:hypothetical protein
MAGGKASRRVLIGMTGPVGNLNTSAATSGKFEGLATDQENKRIYWAERAGDRSWPRG